MAPVEVHFRTAPETTDSTTSIPENPQLVNTLSEHVATVVDHVDAPEVQVLQKNHLRCMYTNIDSLPNKWAEFQVYVNTQQPDIIAVTEVVPKNIAEPLNRQLYNLVGYDLEVNPTQVEPGERDLFISEIGVRRAAV